jgi:hypothetical protein
MLGSETENNLFARGAQQRRTRQKPINGSIARRAETEFLHEDTKLDKASYTALK